MHQPKSSTKSRSLDQRAEAQGRTRTKHREPPTTDDRRRRSAHSAAPRSCLDRAVAARTLGARRHLPTTDKEVYRCGGAPLRQERRLVQAQAYAGADLRRLHAGELTQAWRVYAGAPTRVRLPTRACLQYVCAAMRGRAGRLRRGSSAGRPAAETVDRRGGPPSRSCRESLRRSSGCVRRTDGPRRVAAVAAA